MEEILALFVAFGEALRPKCRTKLGRMQVSVPMFEFMSAPTMISNFAGSWLRRLLSVSRKRRCILSLPVYVHGW